MSRLIDVDAQIDMADIDTRDLHDELKRRGNSVPESDYAWLQKFIAYYENASLSEQMECELLLNQKMRLVRS